MMFVSTRIFSVVIVVLCLTVFGAKNSKKKTKERDDEVSKERDELILKARSKVAVNATLVANATQAPDGFYDFIFGWSTGHVGTTTLSEKRMYGSPDNVTFLHEMKYGRIGLPTSQDVYSTSEWLLGNFTQEYEYVKTKYVPWLLRNKYPKSRTVMDLGHNINYFYDALIKYLLTETKYKFVFVRLRRERMESAQSLTFGHPEKAFNDLCSDLITRFCPFDRIASNILQLPGPNAYALWSTFSNIQKALWIADETEARWQEMKKRYGDQLNYIELLWGKKWDGSIDFAALQIAQLFGLSKVNKWDPTWPHMEAHVHAGDAALDPNLLWESYRADKEYQEKMKYTYVPA